MVNTFTVGSVLLIFVCTDSGQNIISSNFFARQEDSDSIAILAATQKSSSYSIATRRLASYDWSS
jgi:hypothetical protein